MYKTVVLDYHPGAERMAQEIETKANEMAQEGWELVTVTVTGTAKAIMVCRQTR